jgi:hypothetical protein
MLSYELYLKKLKSTNESTKTIVPIKKIYIEVKEAPCAFMVCEFGIDFRCFILFVCFSCLETLEKQGLLRLRELFF